MKTKTFKILVLCLLINLTLFFNNNVTAQTFEWTWMKGDSITYANGVYGTMGVSDPANKPGNRFGVASWIDVSDNLWLFGGNGGGGSLNDLWKYNPNTNEWTWVKGDSTVSIAGVYGTMGVSDPANMPGSTWGAISWTDNSGNFWLMGGYGYDVSGSWGWLDALWKYYPGSNEWTWMKGNNTAWNYGIYGTMGISDSSNKPGGRWSAHTWTDTSGNLWLFGGEGRALSNSGYLNDLWKYNPSTNEWTWMKGDDFPDNWGTYGTPGVPDSANNPGPRNDGISWIDASGNLYLWGGYGNSTSLAHGHLNDLWKYDPVSNEWTWINGENDLNKKGVYGTQGISDPANFAGGRNSMVSWVDGSGILWIFGGTTLASGGSEELNDLWKYNPSTYEWTWMKGDSANNTIAAHYGTYGTQSVSDQMNTPGGRAGAVGWVDNAGNNWLFGGSGNSTSGADGLLNDLWKFNHGAVSIEQVSINSFEIINLYPNPFSSSAAIVFDNKQGKEHSISIYNYTGQLVRIINGITSGRIEIKRKGLPAGLYFYKITADNGIIGMGKMVAE